MRSALIFLALCVAGCAGKRGDGNPEVGTLVRAEGAQPAAAATTPGLPGVGQPCAEGRCAEGLSCVEYFGVAGPRGPKFSSCEQPCPTGQCPAGRSCVTIADGPGAVCR